MAPPPNNPTPSDPDVFTPEPDPAPEVTNTPLTAAELNRQFIAENRAELNAQANDGVGTGDYGDDYSKPEPPKSAQIAGSDGFDDGGEDSIVSKPTDSENTMTAGGKATKASDKAAISGLTAQLDTISIDPRPNQLSNFASFTYNLALYMMGPKRYVELLKRPSSVASIPKQLLMRSGGVGNDGGENFGVDFFIDNLQMKNMATSPNNNTNNTNAVEISFDITEPMGITLIERLKNEAKNSLEEGENYIGTPYLLEITFKGYDDSGKEIVGEIKPKYVPIKIIDLRFKLESTGTVYKVKGVPYHQDILSSMTSTIPINVQVSAGTVNDIFGGTAQQFNYENETLLTVDYDDELGEEEGSTLKETVKTKTVLGESASSLVDAVNNFFIAQTKPSESKDPKKKGTTNPPDAEIAEKWSFAISPEISGAKLVGSRFDALNTPQKTSKVYKQASAGLANKVNLDSKTNLFKINASTNVISLINYIVVASEYIDSNIVKDLDSIDPKVPLENKEIRWFKVVPQITEYLGWDKKQARYKFHVTWTVITTGMYYSDFPWAPQSKPKGEGVHKMYDYIFSGLNTEVTDLQVFFDSAYYQAHTIGTGIKEADKDKSNLAPKSKSLPQSKQGQGIINDETDTKKRGKDLMSNLMFDGADMIQLDMGILGDPAFLPVGDAFFQPQGNKDSVYNDAFLPDGTINYDLTPPYIQLNLKTPTDYDEISGLIDFSREKNKYGSSEFSGVYKVISTTSTFVGGRFEQKLMAVREKMQPIKGKMARSAESLQEREDKAEIDNADAADNLFNRLLSGRNPLESLISQGTTLLSTVGDSIVTGVQANRLQRLADENDQGQFEEGIGDEEPPLLLDNNRTITISDIANIFKE